MVPEPEFESYYGRPIIKQPTWKSPDVPLYLFLGGLAGASAVLAEGAALTGRPGLERIGRYAATSGAGLGTVFLIKDLGRPERFLKMLRVFKVTSPLSVGSYVLAPFGTLTAVAVGSRITGWFPRLGRLAGLGSAALGPALATYTGALLANTAVPVWHEGHRELPVVFGASGAAAGGGLATLLAPAAESSPAVRMGVLGGAIELAGSVGMEKRLGMLAEPYRQGKSGRLTQLSRALTVGGLALTALGTLTSASHDSRGAGGSAGRPGGALSSVARRLGGAALVAGSLSLRFAVFEAGRASAKDPKYTVIPQRERAQARQKVPTRHE